MEAVLIFADGESPGQGMVDDLPSADLVIAADGGYRVASELGLEVDVLVGDLDSVAGVDIPEQLTVELHPEEKDATDLELAMELAMRREPGRVVVVGGSGGRFDHELAIAQLLCAPIWDDAIHIDWLTRRARCHVVRGRRTLHGDPGCLVSLLPVGGDALGVRTRGLKWELHGDTLGHGSTRGVSNVLQSPVADIRVERGCLLVVVPAAAGPARP